ncbi:MAG: TolC family protein [Bdellovibrionaceae bacterium]|nr:TolC family protein [Pseudobdellovibrionaceae bacterium]
MFKIQFLLLPLFFSIQTVAQTQNNVEQFKTHSPFWQALEVEKQALEKQYQAMDLEVATQFNLELIHFTDDRKALLVLPVKQEELFLSANISKYFSTGTRLEFLTNTTSTEYRTLPGTNHLGSFQLSLSQNLWRDFFGQGDDIRRKRNLKDYELKLLQVKMNQAQLLLRFEQILWDYIAANVELRLRQESLRRWTEIETWMRGRYKRLVAELVDVKQISATKILRDIQVQTIKQRLENLKNELDQLGGDGFSNKIVMTEDLLQVSQNEISKASDAFSIETQILDKTAEVAEQDMLRTAENIKPDLKLSFAVGRRGIDNSATSAWIDAYDSDHFFTQAALTFSTPLDFSLLKKSSDSAKLMYEAANIRKTQSLRSARLEWTNLQGQIQEHFRRIKLLRTLTKEQQDRNEAERKRFLNGRSTSLQVVTAEQETLDAELTLRNTQAALKKLIAQYRLFEMIHTGD